MHVGWLTGKFYTEVDSSIYPSIKSRGLIQFYSVV